MLLEIRSLSLCFSLCLYVSLSVCQTSVCQFVAVPILESGLMVNVLVVLLMLLMLPMLLLLPGTMVVLVTTIL